MSDLVEFRHLKYIAAIAETNNFTRAAERLFLAQPSLSKQIKELEDAIGFPIFTRTREPLVELFALSSRLKIFQDPELHPSGHAKLIGMFTEMGFKLDMVCTASTSSDIQWMVRAGYGIALIDQGAVLDPVLTTRQIAGVHWTADTAFVHHRECEHIALRFVTRFLQRIWKRTLRKMPVARKDDAAVQLNLLA